MFDYLCSQLLINRAEDCETHLIFQRPFDEILFVLTHLHHSALDPVQRTTPSLFGLGQTPQTSSNGDKEQQDRRTC